MQHSVNKVLGLLAWYLAVSSWGFAPLHHYHVQTKKKRTPSKALFRLKIHVENNDQLPTETSHSPDQYNQVIEKENVTEMIGLKEVDDHLDDFTAMWTKVGMISYIISMCLALPIALLPLSLSYNMGMITKKDMEYLSLEAGEMCARTLLTMIPFVNLKVWGVDGDDNKKPEPSIWVLNHTSMLDAFMLLAADQKLRGKHKRPIKFVYWKGLEANPVTKILFQMCGFIPVQMEGNAAGVLNNYDAACFRQLLKDAKTALEDGFDLGVLPEGQLNPHPELGLQQPIYSGAFTLAKMSHRPIRMIGMHGIDRLWNAEESLLKTSVIGKDVTMKAYPGKH
eukprot:scaffold212549_cov45-Attheya_sp.AAC.1